MKNKLLSYILKPRKLFASVEATNIAAIKKRIVPGDVLLLSGSSKMDSVIKTLTEAIWSQALLYLGNHSGLLDTEQQIALQRKYGADALKYLVLESNPITGIQIKTLDSYAGSLLRHCQPTAITKSDRQNVIDAAVKEYSSNESHEISHRAILFYLLPWGILPYRMRAPLAEYSLTDGESICSGTVARAFHTVGYPIRPVEVIQNRTQKHRATTQALRNINNRGKSAFKLMLSGKFNQGLSRLGSKNYARIAHSQVRNLAPGDYDLSRFFNVVKDPRDLEINY